MCVYRIYTRITSGTLEDEALEPLLKRDMTVEAALRRDALRCLDKLLLSLLSSSTEPSPVHRRLAILKLSANVSLIGASHEPSGWRLSVHLLRKLALKLSIP